MKKTYMIPQVEDVQLGDLMYSPDNVLGIAGQSAPQGGLTAE